MTAPSEALRVPARNMRAGKVLPFALPIAFLLFQSMFFWLAPRRAPVAAYVFMVASPWLAGLAALYRAQRSGGPARIAWYATALALFV